MKYLTGCQYYFVDEAIDVSLVTCQAVVAVARQRLYPCRLSADARGGVAAVVSLRGRVDGARQLAAVNRWVVATAALSPYLIPG